MPFRLPSATNRAVSHLRSPSWTARRPSPTWTRVLPVLALVLAVFGTQTAAAGDGDGDEATAPKAASAERLAAIEAFILDKLSYDLEYFERIAGAARRGRRPRGMAELTFAREKSRARQNLPVLKRFAAERERFANGEPFSLPANVAQHVAYTNLLAMLNLLQAQREGRFDAVLAWSARIYVSGPEDFGRVRGRSGQYYRALYREYFFATARAHYVRGDDDAALLWFAKLKDDPDLASLRQQVIERKNEDASTSRQRRLRAIRRLPLAVAPFVLEGVPEDDAFLASALPQSLLSDLVQSSDLVLIERSQLDAVWEEVALKLGDFVEGREVAEAGKLLGAEGLVLGSVVDRDGRRAISLRLVDASTGRVLATSSTGEDVEPADAASAPFDATRDAAVRLMDAAGWTDAIATELLASRPRPDLATVKTLHAARLELARDKDAARQLFAEAVRADPAAANLYRDLREEFADVSATVAVLPFRDLNGDGSSWRSHAVQTALTTDMPKLGFSVVERQSLDQLLVERAEADTALAGEDAKRLGDLLSADFIATGSVLAQPPLIRIDTRIVDVRTGTIVLAASVEDRDDDLGLALQKLASAVADHFNQPLPPDVFDELTDASLQFTPGVDATQTVLLSAQADPGLLLVYETTQLGVPVSTGEVTFVFDRPIEFDALEAPPYPFGGLSIDSPDEDGDLVVNTVDPANQAIQLTIDGATLSMRWSPSASLLDSDPDDPIYSVTYSGLNLLFIRPIGGDLADRRSIGELRGNNSVLVAVDPT